MKAKILIIILLLIFIMTGIVHERIVASRDKGLAEDWNANHQITGDVDMGQYSWLNQVIENRVDFPAGPVEGQVVYRADENKFYIYDGAAWITYLDANNYTDYVAIPHGTYYWSCPAVNFLPARPSTNDLIYSAGFVTCVDNAITFYADVELPQGAVVTAVIVNGNAAAAAETWYLMRVNRAAGTYTQMATAKINTQDNTITNPTIDNNTYAYTFQTNSLDNGDRIYGARIIYTI